MFTGATPVYSRGPLAPTDHEVPNDSSAQIGFTVTVRCTVSEPPTSLTHDDGPMNENWEQMHDYNDAVKLVIDA